MGCPAAKTCRPDGKGFEPCECEWNETGGAGSGAGPGGAGGTAGEGGTAGTGGLAGTGGPSIGGSPGDGGACLDDEDCTPVEKCQSGQCVCKNECDGQCVDVLTNGAHCGFCDHDCKGVACSQGFCAPVVVVGAGGVVGLAVDSTRVYYTATDGNGVGVPYWADKSTTQSVDFSPTNQIVQDLAIDAANVYVSTTSAVWKYAKSGGNGSVLWNGGDAYGLAASASHVYFAHYSGNQVLRVPIAGGTALLVASVQSAPTDVLVDEKNVYWATQGKLKKAPLVGGAPVVLHSGSYVEMMAQDETRLIATDAGSSEIIAISKSGGVAVTLASGVVTYVVAADAQHAYYTAGAVGSQTILRVPLSGGTSQPLAKAEKVVALATDATHLYWAEQGTQGGIYRAAK